MKLQLSEWLDFHTLDILETEYIFKEEKCNTFWLEHWCLLFSIICFWELALKYVAL